MSIICDVCMHEIFFSKRERNSVLYENTLFCSSNCFLVYLKENSKINISEYPDVFKPATISYPDQEWSEILNKFFRSKYEVIVAEWLFFHGINTVYEEITIDFMDGSTYTPDFYLPDLGYFIEVKGSWLGSGKKKLKRAINLGIQIELLPYYLKNSFIKDLKNEIFRRRKTKINA